MQSALPYLPKNTTVPSIKTMQSDLTRNKKEEGCQTQMTDELVDI